MSVHDQVHAFSDGELAPDEAEAFREHLSGCAECQRELEELLQLQALAFAAKPAAQQASITPISTISSSGRRRRVIAVVAPLLAMAAGLALFVRTQGGDELLSSGPVRHLEARSSYASADHWRRYDVERAAGTGRERPNLKLLARLEDRGDWRGLAAAYLLAGDRDQAATYLDKAGHSPEVDNDRAVLAMEKGDFESAISFADSAFAAQPALTQALWNRALAERELGLINRAAQSFTEVASRNEPGWADEAKQRAAALAKEAQAEAAAFAAIDSAGKEMMAGGPVMSTAMARAGSGIARHYFYDALRGATTRERVLAFLPLAEELDRLDHGEELQRYVHELAVANFAARAPLAALYQTLTSGKGPNDPAAQEQLLDRLRKSGQKDLLLGALLLTFRIFEHFDEFRQLALASGDRNFIGMAEYYSAGLQQEKNDVLGALQTLARSVAGCERGVQLRCGFNEVGLTAMLVAMHRVAEARTYALSAWQRARRLGDDLLAAQALAELGEVHLLANRFPLVRAYLTEGALRQPKDPGAQQHAHETLAVAAVYELKPDIAHTEIGAVIKSGVSLDVNGVWVLADLSHRGLSADERKEGIDSLAQLRKLPGLDESVLSLFDFLEGRLDIDLDGAKGKKLLRQAIEKTDRLPHDNADARKARSFAYQTLIAADGESGNWSDALALFAEEAELRLPERCVVGVATDNERDLSIVRDAGGQFRGTLRKRTQPTVDAAHFVPADQVSALAGCPSVTVLARPPLYGSPDLLPPTLAWSYRIGHPHGTQSAGPVVVISDVEPPATLRLPKLNSWRAGNNDGRNHIDLTGSAATPARVLSEIADAGEIIFNAHGLVDTGQSDATMLALSSDADGRYALSVADLRGVHLRGSPLVVLAACRAGDLIVPSPHEPISLPAAFLRAGARSVLASSAPIPDADAGDFFDAVRARANKGAALAIALRDERAARLERDHASWTRDVMLFE